MRCLGDETVFQNKNEKENVEFLRWTPDAAGFCDGLIGFLCRKMMIMLLMFCLVAPKMSSSKRS